MTAAADTGAALGGTPTTTAESQSWARRNIDLLFTPIVVVIVLVILITSVASSDLDPRERATIAPSVIAPFIGQHVLLTVISSVIVLLIAVPLGIVISRRGARRLRGPVLTIGGYAQALPPLGFLLVLAFALGFSTLPVILALVLASLLPVLRNTVVGLQQVDQSLVEAARGMGMSNRQALLRVEFPLAVPVVMAGLRVALVLNVGTAALAFSVGAGGLGFLIQQGNALGYNTELVVGAVLVGCLALTIDWLGGVAERLVGRRGG